MGILQFIKTCWNLILCVWYLLAILFLAFFLFAINDQGKDFIYTVILNDDSWYVFISTVFLVFWCFITWYSCSVILYDYTDRRRININPDFKMIFGRVIGLLPLLILLTAVLTNHLIKANMGKRLLITLFFIAVGIVLYLIFSKLTNQKKSDYYPLYSAEYSFRLQLPPLEKKYLKSRIKFIKMNKGIRIFVTWYGSFFIGVIFVFLFNDLNYSVSEFLKPPVIVITALCMFTFIATVINIFHDIRKLPILPILIVALYVFSTYNENGMPNALQKNELDYAILKKRDSMLPFFKEWVDVKLRHWKDTLKPMPVFLIANQGGGTRGSAWSSFVLQKLDSMYRDSSFQFYEQIFLMSGASGGGVGGNFYNAIKANQENVQQGLVYKLWKKDHLTSLTAALTFRETLAALLPFPLRQMEGTKMLEYSWARSFAENVPTNTFSLDDGFLSMWYKREGLKFKFPSVFINGVLAETGQKIITSNLVLPPDFLGKNLDYHQITGKDIRYNTAMTFCSRFPVLTSESLVIDTNGKAYGHILDGGLLENTATTSLYFFIDAIKPFINEKNKAGRKIEIVLLYLQNSGDSDMPISKSNSAFRIIANPFNALLNTSGIGVEQDNKTKMLEVLIKNNPAYHYFNIRLGYDKFAYPLGLYMSTTVLDQMVRRVDSIPQKDSALIHYLQKFKKS